MVNIPLMHHNKQSSFPTPGSQMMMAPNSPASEVTSEWTPHSADVDEEGTQPFGDPCPKIKQNVIFQVSKTIFFFSFFFLQTKANCFILSFFFLVFYYYYYRSFHIQTMKILQSKVQSRKKTIVQLCMMLYGIFFQQIILHLKYCREIEKK